MNKLSAQESNKKSFTLEKTLCFDKCAWITWEEQRRTNELAKALNVPVFKLISRRSYVLRIGILSIRTALLIIRNRPEILFVQNPSIVLAALACLLQQIFKYVLIVDRHSNFRIEKAPYRSVKEKIFQILSRYTIREAHLTIVTNEFLKNLVEKWGGRGFVLQDKLPVLDLAEEIELEGKHNVVFVCSFSGDEPVAEVIEAARLIDPSVMINITGNSGKLPKNVIKRAPRNVRFTDFLDEETYQSLLYSSDVVMVLTTADHFLLCGAYEAISLGKPVILSETPDLMDYFCNGAIFTRNDAQSLADAMDMAVTKKEELEEEVSEFRTALEAAWDERFQEFMKRLEAIGIKKESPDVDFIAY